VIFTFDPDADSLDAAGQRAVARIARTLAANPRLERLRVEGVAEAGERKDVAKRRATTVLEALVKVGVDRARLEVGAGTTPGRAAELFVVRRGGQALAPPRPLSLDPMPSQDELDAIRSEHGQVRYAYDTQLPSNEEGERQLEQERAECTQCNGDWGPHGLSGRPSCYCRTKDGGKACNRPSDCESACELPWEQALGLHGIRCDASGCTPSGLTIPTGTCSTFQWHHGCQGWIEEKNGVRGVGYICRD
jgi:hypothetical protein